MRISPFDLEQLYSVTQLCISNMNYRLWIQENNNHFTCIYLPFCYRYLGVIFRADVSCDKPIRSEVMMICFFLHFYLCDIFQLNPPWLRTWDHLPLKISFPFTLVKNLFLASLKDSNFGSWSLSTHNGYMWTQCMNLIYSTPFTTPTSYMSRAIFATHIFIWILYPTHCLNLRSLISLLPPVFL
jgi:hypothetical protein